MSLTQFPDRLQCFTNAATKVLNEGLPAAIRSLGGTFVPVGTTGGAKHVGASQHGTQEKTWITATGSCKAMVSSHSCTAVQLYTPALIGSILAHAVSES